ncbi:MAG: hypothetical protein ACKPEQ_13010 [Dolichospermum sp.]
MKAQSFAIRTLKHQIQACLRLIALHVKSAILRLIDLESQLEVAMNEQLTPEKEYLAEVARNKEANQENRNGEFFWGFCAGTAEALVVELCQKYKCQPSEELLLIAVNSINSGSKCSVWTLEKNVKRALEHWERVAQWEKEAEAKWAEAEEAHTNSPITKIIQAIEENELVANLWEKYGKVRIYINDRFGEKLGYVDLTDIKKPKFWLEADASIAKTITLEILGA